MRYYDTFSEAWVAELEGIRRFGEEVSPRGQTTTERRWEQFAVSDPRSFPVVAEGRTFANVIGVLEGLSLVGQFSVPELFTSRVKKFAEFTDAGVFHGSYGARVHGRLGDLVELLERDPDTRQAALSIFDSRSDLGVAKRDIPCTFVLHFLVRDAKLEMRAVMRSNDIWLGTPYDLTQFAILQCSVAQALGLEPGTYVHSASSLHLYERDRAKALLVGAPDTEPGITGDLWGGEGSIADISSRARRLCLDPAGFVAETEFEAFCKAVLEPGA